MLRRGYIPTSKKKTTKKRTHAHTHTHTKTQTKNLFTLKPWWGRGGGGGERKKKSASVVHYIYIYICADVAFNWLQIVKQLTEWCSLRRSATDKHVMTAYIYNNWSADLSSIFCCPHCYLVIFNLFNVDLSLSFHPQVSLCIWQYVKIQLLTY